MMAIAEMLRPRIACIGVLFGLVAGCRNPEQASRPEPRGVKVAGIVEEVRQSAPYSYLRVRTAEGNTWVAVPRASVQAGATIQVVNGVALKSFDAPGLGRFDTVVFGVVQQ